MKYENERELNRILTHEMKKEMVGNVFSSLKTAMAVVNTDKGGISSSFNLTVIFKNLISLENSKRELSKKMLLEVAGPQQGFMAAKKPIAGG